MLEPTPRITPEEITETIDTLIVESQKLVKEHLRLLIKRKYPTLLFLYDAQTIDWLFHMSYVGEGLQSMRDAHIALLEEIEDGYLDCAYTILTTLESLIDFELLCTYSKEELEQLRINAKMHIPQLFQNNEE